MDQLYFVVHTHWDREWYQPFQQMRARLVTMADRMIPLVERGTIPSFHFDGQTIVLDDYLEMRPRAERRLRNLIRAGKIQVGPWYVLADSFLVSGESLIRNLEIGMAIARRFGRPLDVGYLPDQFGHIAQMPQILAGFGFTTAVLWRGVGADVNRNRFVWEALDGSSVLTVYMPNGYSNGANLPLESVDSFVARAERIADRERDFAAGTPILVMTGTDHAEPDPRLTARIIEAREISAMTFETGSLEDYVLRLAELPLDGTPRHRGELRSPLRSHLLPGVTSARTWIKQRDFENCRALERYADPLAALANALGRGASLDAFLEMAWRTEIQNHPHDSICGCSVDQVHIDMRYRFDQAAMLAETAVRRAAALCLNSRNVDASEIAVFNPSLARRALVTGEAEIADPDARYVVETSDGRRIPVAIDVAREQRALDSDMPTAEFKSIVVGLSQPAVFGRTVNRFEITTAPDGRLQVNLFMSRAAFSDLDLEQFRHAVRTRIPDSGSMRIHATSAARCAVSFVADDLAQSGFSFYRLVRDDSAAVPARPESVASIENEFFRLTPTPRGLEIRDLARNTAMELYFEDDGDRGDEYNFDPVSDGASIASPASISASVVDNGPVRKRIKLSMTFEIPASLTTDRRARSPRREQLDVALIATLYQGFDRVDFIADVTNRSQDHRLRAALRTPIFATEAVNDTSFGVLRRPLAPSEPRGTEDIYPTVPQRTFTAVEGAEFSAALASRGILEVEARPERAGTTILLTLLRCVGWLSRSDLATRRGGAGPELETPDAQEPGEHRFEFAVATFRGSYLESDLSQRVEAYTSPPRVFSGRRGERDSAASLFGCDNPRVIFSTARPLARANSYKVRVYSASQAPETASFTFAAGRRARIVDLRGRPVKRAGLKRSRDGAITLELKPFELVTFEVRARPPAE
ncbi:MAG TPA: glycoside hydrolase family 38 C-terminal domain-containing protein [Candidatus Binatus sp.]|uniref:glycoside hydrolase family 38 N-terminal domain-containing protein n=1 Tax=Candidatus Binatus sp. TaxID=2811406 RepID=UPI002B465424|nr:glycoside hydrolase family 38 C-terminal domain-containing protein [Candidatus Binatus sp.]HKN15154.1 glycoside hydrolase family 38 C-terminal domain-containing protein [Candidatus Binatus sp.]